MMVSIATTLFCWRLLFYYALTTYSEDVSPNMGYTIAIAAEPVPGTTEITAEPLTDITELTDEPITVTTEITDEPITVTTEITAEPITDTTELTDEPITVTTELTDEPITDTTELTDEPITDTTEITPESITDTTDITTESVTGINGTTAEPVKVSCSCIDVTVEHVTPLNDSSLYIGSKATVTVSVVPVGLIQKLLVNVSQYGGSGNIDIRTKGVHATNEVKYTKGPSHYWNRHHWTGFQRHSKMGYNIFEISASGSNRSRQQLFCDFRIYMHNAKGLEDGQNVSIKIGISYLQNGIFAHCPRRLLNLTARTTLLERNKTAYFEMDPMNSSLITDINLITKLTFRAWVPNYKPLIKVLLKRNSEYLGLAYLRVSSVGDAFYTVFSDTRFLNVTRFTDTGVLLLEFPWYWVNREYYTYPNTTDSDVIVFEAGVYLTDSAAGQYSNFTVGINILFNETEAWNTTFSLLGNSTGEQLSLHELPLVNVSIFDDSSPESIFPPRHFSLVLDTIPNKKDTLNISLWTQETNGRGESAMVIGNVSFYGADKSIVYENLTVTYDKTENSPINNLAMIQLKYINSAKEHTTNLLNLMFDVSIVPENMNFANTYTVHVAIGNLTSEHKIGVKLPEIWNDINNTLLGQFHKLLDADNNTCVDLPIQGNFPPMFWTRFHTSWIGVDLSPFEVTLIGKGISCNGNGKMVSKVVLPTTNSTSGFHGDLKFCNVTDNGDMNISKCVYNCECKNDVECSEVILFMANHELPSGWVLCEMSAVRV